MRKRLDSVAVPIVVVYLFAASAIIWLILIPVTAYRRLRARL